MKNIYTILRNSTLALALFATGATTINAAVPQVTGWGDFKLFLDPGHSGKENQGLWGYSEAEKTLRVAWSIRDYLQTYTDMPAANLKLCRETDADNVSLDERTDAANAWGADFYYSIHSDAGGTDNTTLFLFGGWKNNGAYIEKTPNGGKKFGDILNPNLTGVMKINTRGVYYDRVYYNGDVDTHENQYPYLHVNRESNMASMLSEAGFHTIAAQQQKNMNADYKKLEGYSAFRTILGYLGLQNPVQTILTGIVTNSENNVPVNGATITIDGKTYTTDTYESLFNKYTKNPDLIHNGFYMFENLTPGKAYDISFEAPGYGKVTKSVTIASEPTKYAADNVTWCDVELTSNAPAKISSISIADPLEVNMREPVIITFSRFMDKASVESAFSINNNGKVSLSWDNNYTLKVDISKLIEDNKYTITINGDIAKNSQTNQKLDGNGDGTEGGNYTFSFTTLPPDVTAPQIVSTTPKAESEVVYTNRPVIRVEFNEPIVWNEDELANAITITDKDGKSYAGTLKHNEISGASVLQYYFKEDLPLDKAFLVKVAGGIKDKSGNASEAYAFRFLSEYRPETKSIVLDPFTTVDNWYTPGGSGSSKGLVENGATGTVVSETSKLENTSCFQETYEFDPYSPDNLWQIRWYKRDGSLINDLDGIIKVFVCGDGSHNSFGFSVRANSYSGGVKVQNPKTIDFRGWQLMYWNMKDGDYFHLSNTDQLTAKWLLDALFMRHLQIEEGATETNPDTGEEVEIPQQALSGTLKYDEIRYTYYDKTAKRTAALTDVNLSGVEDVITNDMIISIENNAIKICANNEITKVEIYNLAGQQVYVSTPKSTSTRIASEGFGNGAFIVKVNSVNGTKTQKVIL